VSLRSCYLPTGGCVRASSITTRRQQFHRRAQGCPPYSFRVVPFGPLLLHVVRNNTEEGGDGAGCGELRSGKTSCSSTTGRNSGTAAGGSWAAIALRQPRANSSPPTPATRLPRRMPVTLCHHPSRSVAPPVPQSGHTLQYRATAVRAMRGNDPLAKLTVGVEFQHFVILSLVTTTAVTNMQGHTQSQRMSEPLL
jgi:hypothetical protein